MVRNLTGKASGKDLTLTSLVSFVSFPRVPLRKAETSITNKEQDF